MEKINLNHATDITEDQLQDVMDFHPWGDDQVEKGVKVREVLSDALDAIIKLVPPGPDRSAAIRKLREARMDCNSAITHGGFY